MGGTEQGGRPPLQPPPCPQSQQRVFSWAPRQTPADPQLHSRPHTVNGNTNIQAGGWGGWVWGGAENQQTREPNWQQRDQGRRLGGVVTVGREGGERATGEEDKEAGCTAVIGRRRGRRKCEKKVGEID